MRLPNSHLPNLRNLIAAACLVLCAFGGAQAQTPDIAKLWTNVGSDGTLDETDDGKVFFDKSVVQMGRPPAGNLPAAGQAKQSAALTLGDTQSAVIRYNVAPVDGLFTPPCKTETGRDCTGRQLILRYLAAGGGRVVAKLIEVDLATGGEVTHLSFDSNAFSAANDYRVQHVDVCGPKWRFDFRRKAYYVEATLTGSRLAATTAAGIQMIKIGNTNCTSIN
jgi:hypothetical protein